MSGTACSAYVRELDGLREEVEDPCRLGGEDVYPSGRSLDRLPSGTRSLAHTPGGPGVRRWPTSRFDLTPSLPGFRARSTCAI
jgi:hypothetical protein